MKGEAGAINARKGWEVKPRTRRRRQRKRGAGVGVENVNWHRSNYERPQPNLSPQERHGTAPQKQYRKSPDQLEGGEG
ncbi:unnamed protein product [Fusarium graminearum]|nr:unnamed protein product [Fusarium graminearum]